MGFLPLLLSSVLGAAATVLALAIVALLSRAQLVHAVRELVAGTMKAHADELVAQARDALGGEAQAAADTLVALRSERGRVMAMLRHHGAPRKSAGGEEGEADGGGDGFLDGLAQSFGIDAKKLAAGDKTELAKLEPMLAQLAQLKGTPATPDPNAAVVPSGWL